MPQIWLNWLTIQINSDGVLSLIQRKSTGHLTSLLRGLEDYLKALMISLHLSLHSKSQKSIWLSDRSSLSTSSLLIEPDWARFHPTLKLFLISYGIKE